MELRICYSLKSARNSRSSMQIYILLRTTQDYLSRIIFLRSTECLPYDDSAIALWVTGTQLKKMILYMLRDEVWDGSHCEFFQFSEGVKVIYNRRNHDFKAFSLNGEPIEDSKIL